MDLQTILYGIHFSSPTDLIVDVQFDPLRELLWTCTDSLITSYIVDPFVPNHYVYTRFPATCLNQSPPNSVVQSFMVNDHGIYSMALNSVSLTSRNGIPLWTFKHDSPLGLRCMTSGDRPTEVIIASQNITLMSLSQGKLFKEVPAEEGISILKKEKYLACAGLSGTIYVKDTKTLRTQSQVSAHKCTIASMDIMDNYLISCAYSERGNPYALESVIKCHDLRQTGKVLHEVNLQGARFVKFSKNCVDKFAAASIFGSALMYDFKSSIVLSEFSVDTQGNYITAMDFSTSGGRLAFADLSGYVHSYNDISNDFPGVNKDSLPISITTPDYRHLEAFDVDSVDRPFSSIGMPHYQQTLFSAHWPLKKRYTVGKPHPKIPEDLLEQMKLVDFVGYAPNLEKGVRRRNQVREPPKHREISQERSLSDTKDVTTAATLPEYYRKQKIGYGRFGLDNFDFSRFNQTEFAGFENDVQNCYLNAFLQVLIFSFGHGTLRTIYEWHLNGSNEFRCDSEVCLLCELGFLSKMMRDAKGSNCRASNFFRTFSMTKEAKALGLLEPEKLTPQTSFHLLIQNFNRFVLQKLDLEAEAVCPKQPLILPCHGESLIRQICGITLTVETDCSLCKHSSTRPLKAFSIDLVYPKPLLTQIANITLSSPKKKKTFARITFDQLLQESMLNKSQTRAWCDSCQAYQMINHSRALSNLPFVLNINCGCLDDSEKNFWRSQQHDQKFKFSDKEPLENSFIPNLIWLTLDDHGLAKISSSNDPSAVSYEISAFVCQVENNIDVPHLISFVSVDGQWFMFNDFLVRTVSKSEVVQMKSRWKVPAILQYTRTDFKEKLDLECISSNQRRRGSRGLFDLHLRPLDIRGISPNLENIVPLSYDEFPPNGRFLVALDAEFVELVKEETEVKTDGTKSVIRPSKFHLARVSLVRGQGPLEGTAFIDDYIHTTEEVADYLTDFSGIVASDLDFNQSKRTLVSLKTFYRKLRFLLDMNVTFIGHHLASDFRTINIYVKPSQIIDTLHLYSREHKRKISLRFLAWYVLGKDIQAESHDSIVDAQIALELYKKYAQLEADGQFKEYLDLLYEEGRRINWKPPHWHDEQRDNQSSGGTNKKKQRNQKKRK